MSSGEETLRDRIVPALESRLGRRDFVRRAAILGASAPVLGFLLAACGDDDDDAGPVVDPDDDTDETPDADEDDDDDDNDDDEPVESRGGAIVVDLGSEPENLDPHQIVAGTTHRLVEQVCETLLRFEPGTLEVGPWLAEQWDGSDDGLTWTFTLREGVTYHDGADFNAESVKFSFDRQLDDANPYYGQGQWANAARLSFIDEIVAEDEYTAVFNLSSSFNRFLERLCVNAGARLVSPSAVEEFGEEFLEQPVGTGPYKFNRWEKGQQVVLDRFEDYWNGTPGLDQIFFRAIAEDGARQAALMTGEIHLAIEISPEIVQAVENSDNHYLVTGQTGALWFLAINVEFEPFTDVRVRQAINFAVDKEVIVESILGNTVQIAYGPLSPAFADYNPAVEDYYTYDPDRARELLEEAGWDDTQEIVFRTSIGGSGMLQPEEMATVIQDDLRAVGINTRIEVQEFVAWMDAIRNPQNELSVMSWNVAPTEPDTMFQGILSESALPPGFNTSYWVNEEFEEMISIGRNSLDPDEVREAYLRAQEIVMEDAPIVPVCHRLQLFGLVNRVQNFEALPSLELELRGVYADD